MERDLKGASPELEAQLLSYYFGTMDATERSRVEQLLLTSQDALKAFLHLKRSLEITEERQSRPSSAAKARLRNAVQQRFQKPKQLRPWYLRPIPLYQGLFVLGAMLLLFGISWWSWPPTPKQVPDTPVQKSLDTPLFDSSGNERESLDWT